MPNIEPGTRWRFDYPEEFVTEPEYSARRGQMVTVLGVSPEHPPPDIERDEELIYEVIADDGWIGVAYESELVRDE